VFAAQERCDPAWAGDDLQDLGQDLMLQPGQYLGHGGGLQQLGRLTFDLYRPSLTF
jgi:hypothetical protein